MWANSLTLRPGCAAVTVGAGKLGRRRVAVLRPSLAREQRPSANSSIHRSTLSKPSTQKTRLIDLDKSRLISRSKAGADRCAACRSRRWVPPNVPFPLPQMYVPSLNLLQCSPLLACSSKWPHQNRIRAVNVVPSSAANVAASMSWPAVDQAMRESCKQLCKHLSSTGEAVKSFEGFNCLRKAFEWRNGQFYVDNDQLAGAVDLLLPLLLMGLFGVFVTRWLLRDFPRVRF